MTVVYDDKRDKMALRYAAKSQYPIYNLETKVCRIKKESAGYWLTQFDFDFRVLFYAYVDC